MNAPPTMMPSRFPAAWLVTGIALVLLAPGMAFAGGVDRVLVVSIDALHPAALGKKTTPGLYALMQQGQYTLTGQSVDPPKTLIAHTAMLTGLTPERSGKLDNDWKLGEPHVSKPTLFDDAKQHHFRTAFYFAKAKLGYLVSPAVDQHQLTPMDGIDQMRVFFRGDERRFGILHLSGLEYAGTDSGWLSPEYFAELADIDLALAPLLAELRTRGRYAIVITSDHAGHERQHGTRHPEDFKLPLIVVADTSPVPPIPSGNWPITDLRELMRKLLASTATTAPKSTAIPATK